MADDQTLKGFLGPEFQLKVMWQILTETEFAEKIIPNLITSYFDDPNLKRLYVVLNDYFKENEKVPNLQNKSIYAAIKEYSISSDPTDEEILNSVIEKIKNWNDRVLNNVIEYDGEVVQKNAFHFIKQQEYRKIADFINNEVVDGNIRFKSSTNEIEDRFHRIASIGEDEDMGEDAFEDIDDVLKKDFREPIPTGIKAIDELMDGGLGKGEMGIILAGTGVGKTTILTKIANEAYDKGKNVLQIVFEDKYKDIKRKHYAIWSDIELKHMDDESVTVKERVNGYYEMCKKRGLGGKLVIKKFSQDGTTLTDIKRYILRYYKKHGIKFDIVVLDYIDCLEPHRKVRDTHEGEYQIIKAFEAMAGDMDIPCWTAIQANRSGFNAEWIFGDQMGGNIKRAQKSHFLMSVAKTQEQKEVGLANIQILKARFAQDGQRFENCIFNNSSMEIAVTDDIAVYRKNVKVNKADDAEANLIKLNEKTKAVYQKVHDELAEPSTNNLSSDLPDSINTKHVIKTYNQTGEFSGQTKAAFDEMLDRISSNQPVKNEDEKNNKKL